MFNTICKGKALVITGDEGVGKSTVAESIAEVYGSYIVMSSLDLSLPFGLDTPMKHNPDTLIIEGLVDWELVGELIYKDSLHVNRKGRKSMLVATPNFIITTSYKHTLRIHEDSRRFFIIDIRA